MYREYDEYERVKEQIEGGGNRGARGVMAPLKIFLEGPGPSKITDDPSSVMNFYSTLYI